MAKAIITDFSAGEASPRMEGRVDLDVYQRSCLTLQNMVLDTRGGADRRPGSKYVAGAISNSTKSRLIEFEYSATQSFVLELSNTACRVYSPDGTVHTSSLGSPTWTTAQLFEIQYAQSGNTMYLTHTGLSGGVHKIVYTSGTDSFALTAGVTFTGTAFTAAGDVPGFLTFHERRLVMGGTLNDPMALWGSKPPVSATGATQYEDLTVGATAADAYKYILAADKGDQLVWALSSRDLLLGSFGGEHNVTGYDAGITPANIFIKRQSNNGSKVGVKPFLVDDAAVYVRRDGKKVMQQVFARERGGYASSELNFLADHIAGDGIVDGALQSSPDTILWYVTDDGQLIGVTYNRAFGVQGWHEHVTDGTYESVAVLDPSGEDVIWTVVNRTIGGSTVRYIEKFAARDWGTDRNDAFFVDSGITWDGLTEVGAAASVSSITKSATCQIIIDTEYANDSIIQITDCDVDDFENEYMLKSKSGSGPWTYDLYTDDGTLQIDSSAFTAAATSGTATPVLKTITGLAHLNGETVIALRDGAAEEPATAVAAGSVTLSAYGTNIHVGLKYDSILSPMKLLISPGDVMRAHQLVVRFYRSQSVQWGPSTSTLNEVFGSSTVIGQAPDLFTGDKVKEFTGDWTREPTIVIFNDSPNPMSVLFIVAEAKVSGGR